MLHTRYVSNYNSSKINVSLARIFNWLCFIQLFKCKISRLMFLLKKNKNLKTQLLRNGNIPLIFMTISLFIFSLLSRTYQPCRSNFMYFFFPSCKYRFEKNWNFNNYFKFCKTHKLFEWITIEVYATLPEKYFISFFKQKRSVNKNKCLKRELFYEKKKKKLLICATINRDVNVRLFFNNTYL